MAAPKHIAELVVYDSGWIATWLTGDTFRRQIKFRMHPLSEELLKEILQWLRTDACPGDGSVVGRQNFQMSAGWEFFTAKRG